MCFIQRNFNFSNCMSLATDLATLCWNCSVYVDKGTLFYIVLHTYSDEDLGMKDISLCQGIGIF